MIRSLKKKKKHTHIHRCGNYSPPPAIIGRLAIPTIGWSIQAALYCSFFRRFHIWLVGSYLTPFFLSFLALPLLPTHCRCRRLFCTCSHSMTHTRARAIGRTPLDEGSALAETCTCTTLRLTYWVTKATNTHLEYVILDFHATMVARTRLNVTLRVYCLY